jgi:hypothetical protein
MKIIPANITQAWAYKELDSLQVELTSVTETMT